MRASKGEITIDDTGCKDHSYKYCLIEVKTSTLNLDNIIFDECRINVAAPIDLTKSRIIDTQFYDCQFSSGSLHNIVAAILYSHAYEERRQLLDTHAAFMSKVSIALVVQHFIASCWQDFLAIEHPYRKWAIRILRNAFPEEHHLTSGEQK